MAEAFPPYGSPGESEAEPQESVLPYVAFCAALVMGCGTAADTPPIYVPRAAHLVGKAEEVSAADNSGLRYQLDLSLERLQDRRPIWEVFSEILSDVPPEEFMKLPKDGAAEHDRYLYGQATQG